MTETASLQTYPEQTDTLWRFIFDNAPVRGEWVHMSDSWQQVLQNQDYPPALRRVLGEMMAAAALLASMVKMEGRLVLQIRSTGPVDLIMVECTSKHTLRAIAKWNEEIRDEATLLEMTGDGVLALTLDVEGAKQPYQGMINLEGDAIASLLENYFHQSEQLETRLWLAADDHSLAGLLLQQLPEETNKGDEEDWSRLTQLAATISEDELLHLDGETVLHRLFHEEACRLLSSIDLTFSCTCSRERVAKTILMLGEKDANQLVADDGFIDVACEFCNQHYRFDKVDLGQLFSSQQSIQNVDSTIH